ncbi:MAG: CDP-diacylglycerol--serine O-phosphatidyltransferase [Bacteroidetes bacterium RBG_13_43_22]|nr:MAG: CDP-diacylglycerol--serine O-phosphatidyltransferase [Bacteroidetes bacterium RBG_13_43_22]
MKHLPNFITSLNIAAGFISIIYALDGDLETASWFILAAMIFDFLDGLTARLLNAYSSIGKELDSLADIVSFGVAPAVLIYQLLGASLSLSAPVIRNAEGVLQVLVLLSPVIMPVCAGLRLAKFNIDDTQAASFKGLATPANALAVVGIVIAKNYSGSAWIESLAGSSVALISITLILSLLMVTRIPMFSLKFKNLKLKGNEERYILAALVIAVLVIFGFAGAVLIIPLYIVISLISLLFR